MHLDERSRARPPRSDRRTGASSSCSPRAIECFRACSSPNAFLVRFIGGTSASGCQGRRATIVGTRQGEKLTGTPRRDVISALAGNDIVRGLGGNDLICGGRGDDRLRRRRGARPPQRRVGTQPPAAVANVTCRSTLQASWSAWALSLLLLPGLSSASARPSLPRAFLGVVPQGPLGSGDYARMRGVVGTLRIPLDLVRDRAPSGGTTTSARLDEVVGQAAEHGIQVLPFVYGSPPGRRADEAISAAADEAAAGLPGPAS